MDSSLYIKNRILWINSLKLIACVIVILSHINNGFFEYNLGLRNTDITGYINGLVNGERCVCLFCFLSGVFAVNKKITTFKALFVESISRYLYFVLNMLIVGFFILLASKLDLFRSRDALVLFGENAHFAKTYTETLTLRDYLLGVFTFDTAFNPPLWMLPMLLYGNIIIYFINFISSKFNRNLSKHLILIFSLYLCFPLNKLYIGSCILGALLSPLIYIKQKYTKNIIFCILSFVALIVIFSNFLDPLLLNISNFYSLDYETLRCFITVPFIFTLVNYSALFKKVLEIKPFVFLSKLSFPAYLIHWPVLISFTIVVYEIISKAFPYTFSFIATIIISLAAIFVISFFYNLLFEEKIKLILASVKKQLLKLQMFQ